MKKVIIYIAILLIAFAAFTAPLYLSPTQQYYVAATISFIIVAVGYYLIIFKRI